MNQHYVRLVRRDGPVPGEVNGPPSGRSNSGPLRATCALLLLTLALAPQTSGGGEKAEKFKDAVARAAVTREMLSTLTYDEVPGQWRTKVEDKSRENLAIKVFWRGQDKVLEVLWRRDWTGTRSNMFSATVYHGQTKVGKIFGLPGETSASQPQEARGSYSMTTTIKDDGRVSVMFSNNRGYLQVIEVKGRKTRLMDDIEYTKMVVGVGQIIPPLWEAIGELRTQPKEEPRSRNQR
jgi:hypothetical protein